MSDVDALVVGVGARAASGLDARSLALLERAGKSMVRACHIVDHAGEPIGLARVLSVGDALTGARRFVPLAAPALRESVAERRNTNSIAVIVALPDGERHRTVAVDARAFFEELAAASGVAIDVAASTVVPRGRAAGVQAVSLALSRLAAGRIDEVIVGGIDSHFCPRVLEALDADRRVHGADTENGFVPGEGAAFLRIVRASRAAGERRWARIVASSVTVEPRPYGSAEPTHGLGMTKALATVGAVHRQPLRWALTDVVNERHRIDEWLLASGRAPRALADDHVHQQPLLRLGDLGAASAPVLAVIACVGFETGFAPADAALVAVHAEGADRGALVLARPS